MWRQAVNNRVRRYVAGMLWNSWRLGISHPTDFIVSCVEKTFFNKYGKRLTEEESKRLKKWISKVRKEEWIKWNRYRKRIAMWHEETGLPKEILEEMVELGMLKDSRDYRKKKSLLCKLGRLINQTKATETENQASSYRFGLQGWP